MDKGTGLVPTDVEVAIKGLAGNPNRAEAALALASIANRAAAALHHLARAEASSRKGTPDWGRWASLTNASRDAILRTATCRQTANQLYQASKTEPTPASESSSKDS